MPRRVAGSSSAGVRRARGVQGAALWLGGPLRLRPSILACRGLLPDQRVLCTGAAPCTNREEKTPTTVCHRIACRPTDQSLQRVLGLDGVNSRAQGLKWNSIVHAGAVLHVIGGTLQALCVEAQFPKQRLATSGSDAVETEDSCDFLKDAGCSLCILPLLWWPQT